MKTKLITLSMSILFSIISFAQSTNENPDTLGVINTIEQLSFMKGTWKGNGWIMMGRERKTFIQTETISPRVDGKLLIVDGVGYDADSTLSAPKIIHNAFGVISFNQEMNSITMLSYSSTGGKMENKIIFTGEKTIEWSFMSENGATIRFREDFSDEGYWIETGEYSTNGVEWFPFFKMTLERVK